VPEYYDPVTDSWAPIGCELVFGKLSCRKSRLRTGWYPRVVVGFDGDIFEVPANRTYFAYTFDVITELWSKHTIGSADDGKMRPAPAVYYAPGRMLRAGSDLYADSRKATAEATVVDFSDVYAPSERAVAPMSYARNRNTLTILADGSVLTTGGQRGVVCSGGDPYVYHPERFDPVTEQWETLGPMQEKRTYHSTAILLRDGSVLSAGGESRQTGSQIFRPPYLYWGPRPTITATPVEIGWGQSFEVETPAPASISAVHLIRLGAVTHAYDQGQQIARLAFTPGPGGDRITVAAPANAYEAPLGYYMLFLISDLGVPSVAEYVLLEASYQP
jgi:hypothetical protein